MMLRSLVNEWTTALRSGKYQQGQHNLYTVRNGQESHCCLGVFMRTFQREIENIEKCTIDFLLHEHSVLPAGVQKKFGFHNAGGMILGTDSKSNPCGRSLANMNDGGWNFHDIADFIDDNAHLIFAGLVEDVAKKPKPKSKVAVVRTARGQLVLE